MVTLAAKDKHLILEQYHDVSLDNFPNRLYQITPNADFTNRNEAEIYQKYGPDLEKLPQDHEEAGILYFNRGSQKFEYLVINSHPALKLERFWLFEGIKNLSGNKILVQANTDVGNGKTVLLALVIEVAASSTTAVISVKTIV